MMDLTDQQVVTIGYLAALFGLLVIAARIVFVRNTIRRSVFNTSRFPLFAARDNLIDLIRRGVVTEQDPVWSSLYACVNDLLSPNKRHTLFSMFHESLRFSVRVANDKQYRQKFIEFRREQDERAKENPELGRVMEEINLALWNMYYRRTVIFWLRAYLFVLRKLVLALGKIHGGASAVRSLREEVFNDPRGGAPPSCAMTFARCAI